MFENDYEHKKEDYISEAYECLTNIQFIDKIYGIHA